MINMIFVVLLPFPPARHLPARALQWQAGRSRSGEAGGEKTEKDKSRYAGEPRNRRKDLMTILEPSRLCPMQTIKRSA